MRSLKRSNGLSSADYVLLGELAAGVRAVSLPKPRDSADRLVAAGYATSRNLNIRAAAYEITDLGQIALVLSQYGILSPRFTVHPYRHDIDGRWYLIVTSAGNPDLLMTVGTATRLMDHLGAIGAVVLANDLGREIDKARHYAGVQSDNVIGHR